MKPSQKVLINYLKYVVQPRILKAVLHFKNRTVFNVNRATTVLPKFLVNSIKLRYFVSRILPLDCTN